MSAPEALIAELQRHAFSPGADRQEQFTASCDSAANAPVACSWTAQSSDIEVAAREHAEHVAQELVGAGLVAASAAAPVTEKTYHSWPFGCSRGDVCHRCGQRWGAPETDNVCLSDAELDDRIRERLALCQYRPNGLVNAESYADDVKWLLWRIKGLESAPAAIDAAHLARQRAYSELTFGPGMRTAGTIDHIRKELLEIAADPTDLGEWVDVVILGLDGAWRSGWWPQQIIDAIIARQTRNEARSWPDWRTADPLKAIEHDRTGESPPLALTPKDA